MTVLDPVIEFLLSCKRKTVSLAQVMTGADRPRRPVLRVMDRLAREGYLEEIKDEKVQTGERQCGPPRSNPLWRITARPLSARPSLPEPKKRNLRDRLWKIIRMKRRFTRTDLETVSGVSRGSIEDFTQLLEQQGVLRFVGKDGYEKVYLLIKDCGPQRPLFKGAEVKKCRKDG